ncbi:Sucrose-6-phosphate hydrolase [Bacillus sp. 349Y]|nr:Sucrose-6-phosphate hydrolase [Bacillus sp. 349Y]
MTIDIDINQTYRHQYHLMPERGWMNDPNGFSYFKGSYHLFYQHYPYDTQWGPMHWAHAISTDLITWNHLPVALRPSEAYDRNGVFSGSALQVGEEHWLYYTGHVDSHLDAHYDKELKKIDPVNEVEGEPHIRQVQCLAKSSDGLTYIKYSGNPVINTDQVPVGIRLEDFRDPKVWQYDGRFYMVVGAKSEGHIGYVLFYESDDGATWTYLNKLTLGREYGTVWECPDLFELDGKYVLLFSPQEKYRVGNRYENIHSSMALIGSFDHSSGTFSIESEQELDQGFDFYAPQTLLTPDGNRIMMAWMKMWDMNDPLHKQGHGWNGSMTLPRELSLRNGNLVQSPSQTITAYQKNRVDLGGFSLEGEYSIEYLNGKSQRIDLQIDMRESKRVTVSLFKGLRDNLKLILDRERNELTLDRSHSENRIENMGTKNDYTRSATVDLAGKVKLSIFLDVSSMEVFVNDGERVFTSLFYPHDQSDGVVLSSEGSVLVEGLTKWEIVR